MRTPILTVLGVLLLALPSSAERRGQGPGPRAGSDHQEALERWNSLSPEKRQALRERFEAWKGMDEAQRSELRRRHDRLRETERDVRRGLPPDARRCLEGMDSHERRELLREHLEQEFSERGRRMRGLLPPEVRDQLETAAPEERARILGELRQRFEREGLRRGLREVGRELELTPEEVERLLVLPAEVQRAKLLQLRRLEITRRVAREGLPEWIAADQWGSWQSLPDAEFLDRLHDARPRRGSDGGGKGELWRLMRPDPRWFEELAALSSDARRVELERRLAARLLDALDEHPDLVAPAEVLELRALPPREALERLRERLGGRGQRRGGGDWNRERRGPDGQGGFGGPPPRREGEHREPGGELR